MTLLFTWVGKILCLTVNQTIFKVFSRFLGIIFGSIVTKPSAVSLCVQDDSSNKPFICKISVIHFDHPWVSPCQYISSKLDLLFFVVGLPTTDHFLLTTDHYLGSWSRNRQYLEICMPQWQVSRLRQQVASLTFDRMILCNVELQIIYSHFMDCTEYFESYWHYWWLLSHLLTVYIIYW